VNMTGHRSIGDVLAQLKAEFSDITISKIRFLESQGLINPHRTPAGYRQFNEIDIDRLRWILTQQRDRFLPLKVIKQRLDAGGGPRDGDDWGTEAEAPDPLGLDPAGLQLTLDELTAASGLTKVQVAALEKAGVLTAKRTKQGEHYDDDAMLVAKTAAGLLAKGLEVRHLRSYKIAAEREAGILEQLLAAQAHAQSALAQRDAHRSLGQMVILGEELRRALLRQALRGSAII
jgi:DNA-binding transcriptional MerR regulator